MLPKWRWPILIDHLRNRGYQLFDIQQLTEHTASLGAVEIPRGRISPPVGTGAGRTSLNFGTMGE